MPTTTPLERNELVLSKYLVEALGKERQLETALQAQILMASKPQVRLALEDHLGVTRDQIAALQGRIEELGPDEGFSITGVLQTAAEVVGTVANKSLALGKGPLQFLRGTSSDDRELRNLRDCFWNEAEEIAHYQVIEAVAAEIGDRDTLELAILHREQEEEMQRTLERLIAELAHDVVEHEGAGARAGR